MLREPPFADDRSRESRHWCRALLLQTRGAPEQGPPVASGAVNPTALRSHFPVLAERAYLNAGTCGPLPREALSANADVLERAAKEGRTRAYMEATIANRTRQRSAYAERLGADPADVALTTCTSEGIVRVLAGLDLGPGDEVLTAPDEHPG